MSKRFCVPAAAVVALSVFVLMSSVSMPALAQDEGVAATVNGDKILTKDVDKAVEALNLSGQSVSDLKPDERAAVLKQLKPEVLNQIINEKLLEEAVAKSKVEEGAEYKKRLDVLKVQLARQVYLEEQIKDKISDKQVKAEYDKFVKQNKGKVEVRARHILVPSEEEAVQVIKDLDGGADFAELAQKRSSDPSSSRGGELGYFVKEEMVPEFSNEAFSIKKGGYSKKPVKTQFGWHVVKVEDKRDRPVPKLEQVQEAIRQQLGNQALQQLTADLRAKADIKITGEDKAPPAAADKTATDKKADKK